MAENHVIVAGYAAGGYTKTRPAFQYDYGQELQLQGFPEGMLPASFEMHFSIGMGQAITRIGTNGAVAVPNACLERFGTLTAWLFLHDAETDGETKYVIEIPVRSRAKTTDQEPTPAEQSVITEAIAALSAGVTAAEAAQAAAETAQGKAEEAQGAAETAQGKAEEAQGAAEAAANSVRNAAATAETLAPGSDATVTVRDVSGVKTFEFGIPAGIQGETGNGIQSAVLNNDYTLTITYTDGTSYTTPSIRGATGNGIQGAVLNNDYTLTITYTDGTSYTTPSIRGAKGDTGATPAMSIGTVTTGAAGSSAAATMTGTPEAPVLNLTIPRGDPGNATIDDTAGEGDLTKVWSADKNDRENKSLLSAVDRKFEYAYDLLRCGTFDVGDVLSTDKGILVSNGAENEISATTWAASSYIPIPEGTILIESNAVSGSNNYGYAFYDENRQFISGSSVGHYSGFSVEIQPTYKFFRFTSYNANSDHSGVYLKGYCFTSLDLIEESLQAVSDGQLQIDNVQITTEKTILSANGNENSFAGYTTWGCTDFIEIPIGTYKIESNAVTGSTNHGYAFYDEKKQFISGSTSIYTNGFSVNVLPAYKYIRFTDYKANSDHTGVYIKFDNNRFGFHNEDNATLESVINGATLLEGNYTLNSAIQLSENQHINGSNCIITVGENGRLILNKGTSISGLKFVGNWNPTRQDGDGTTYTRFGYVPLISYNDLATENTDALFGQNKNQTNAVVYIQENYAFNATVENCIFEGFDRLAIYVGGQGHKENNNPLICNNYFVDCRMGIYVKSEFARIYANEYLRCIVCSCLLGGNSNSFGEIMKCCDCGFYFPYTTGNTAHNEITSCEAAHCGLAGIYIRELRANLGCQVTGSHFPDSAIVGLTVNNLVITGCRLDCWVKYDSGKGNSIICSNIGKSYLYGNSLFDVPQDTLITLNRGLGTTPDADVNWS